MTDPILLLLSADTAALLLLGCIGGFLPRAAPRLATTGLCGLGVLLCLPSLLMTPNRATFALPFGPPGLSLHLGLDPLSTFFLLILFVTGTATAAQASVASRHRASTLALPLCVAGALIIVLAADGVTLALGIALTGASVWVPRARLAEHALHPETAWPDASEPVDPAAGERNSQDHGSAQSGSITVAASQPVYAIASLALVLIALTLLTPIGSAPRFELIRADPPGSSRLAAASTLATVAILVMLIHAGRQSDQRRGGAHLTSIQTAVIPAMAYLFVRLLLDLPGPSIQSWWGFGLLAAGATVAVTFGWKAVRHPDLDGSISCLIRQQSGLAIVGLGLALIAKAADLPDAASFGLTATLLVALAGGVAGTLACLACSALCEGAGTIRLARLGGLIHTMPIASGALAAALFTLSALPPGAGFAAVWLLFQSLLSAPRTGGLIAQVPMALTAAALALSAALATAASVRLIGIAVLSRPRSVRGSAARDISVPERPVLLALAGVSILLGALPGVVMKALAGDAIASLTGADMGARAGWLTLSDSAPGYAPLPLLGLLALLIGAVVLLTRRARSGYRVATIWNDGQPASPNMPFGDPMAQSAGAGFLPALPGPVVRWRWLPQLTPPSFVALNRPAVGLWVIVLGIGVLLLMLSLSDTVVPA